MNFDIIKSDLYRTTGGIKFKNFMFALKHNKSFRYMFCWRILKEENNYMLKFLIRLLFNNIARTTGIEIPLSVQIGYGCLMVHPKNITINSNAVIGNNLTILKGATVGSQLRGKREGSPCIGDNVYIGLNSTVVGNIKIGNNVLIAPNAYVNFRLPITVLLLEILELYMQEKGVMDI